MRSLIITVACLAAIASAGSCPLAGVKAGSVSTQVETSPNVSMSQQFYFSACVAASGPGLDDEEGWEAEGSDSGASCGDKGFLIEYNADGKTCLQTYDTQSNAWTSSDNGDTFTSTFKNTLTQRTAVVTVVCNYFAGNLDPNGAAKLNTQENLLAISFQSSTICVATPAPPRTTGIPTAPPTPAPPATTKAPTTQAPTTTPVPSTQAPETPIPTTPNPSGHNHHTATEAPGSNTSTAAPPVPPTPVPTSSPTKPSTMAPPTPSGHGKQHGPTNAPKTGSNGGGPDKKKSNKGIIIGVVIGAVALVVIIAAVIGIRRAKAREEEGPSALGIQDRTGTMLLYGSDGDNTNKV